MADDDYDDSFIGGEESFGLGESGTGPIPPPCAICLGFILLVVSSYGIWHSEGDYVKRMKALTEANDAAKQPCKASASGDCKCDLSQVQNADLVFLACNLENLGNLSQARDSFAITDLRPLLDSSALAAQFRWKLQMWQYNENPVKPQEIDLKASMSVPGEKGDYCKGAEGWHHDNDPGAKRRSKICCPTVGYRQFLSQHVGNTKTCQRKWKSVASTSTTATTTTSLTTTSLIATTTTTSTKKGVVGNQVVRRLKKSSEHRRRSTAFTCKFRCYSWDAKYTSKLQPDPLSWKYFPLDKYESVSFLDGKVATNVPSFPFSDSYSNTAHVKVGIFGLGNFKPSTSMWEYKHLKLQPNQGAKNEPLELELVGPPKVLHPGLKHNKYKRSKPWVPSAARIDGSCIYSGRKSASAQEVGDLRVCFQATDLVSMTVLAEARVTSKPELVVSDKYLRAKTKLTSGGSLGYILKKNTIISLQELIESKKAEAETTLMLGRVAFPILLWLAFYCFLSPIIWLIDTMGDALEGIPCIGGCLGGIAEVIETLATILICMVSCCSAVACALLMGAIAWVYYRPMVGWPMLGAAVVIIICLCAFGNSRRGQQKVRRKRQSQMQQSYNPNVQMAQFAQQPMAQPYMGQPMMGQTAMAQPMMGQGMPMAQAQPMMAQPMMQPGMVQPMMGQPMMGQPMMQQQSTMQVQCPAQAFPGSQITVMAPDGRQVMVVVPANVMPGQMFMVQV